MNAQYQGLEFHYIYMMIMAYLVWIIIPGIGFLYAGLARRKSALSMLFQSFAVCGVYVTSGTHIQTYADKLVESASNGCSGGTRSRTRGRRMLSSATLRTSA